MNNKFLPFKKAILIIPATAALLGILAFRSAVEDVYFEINRGIDLFGRVYRELTLHYVDDVNPSDLMEAGIRGMLSTLDPYTIFIDEQNKGDVDMLTTGKYGGIGITVGVRDGKITITAIMEGYSAEREGLRIGDHILEIDGRNIVGRQTDEIRSYIRGEPGSTMRLKVERPGRTDSFELTLKREEIILKNVPFNGMLADSIGYIKLDRFSRRAGEDVREAILELQKSGMRKGLVLDLRDNPGGLLDAAVDIVEKFVPRGSLIVSTRGRKPTATREYRAEEDPIAPQIPLVVLINNASASASEIVAGAIQDLDRGILIGTRTFGKGLVQSVSPLSYNTSLKITTSRYYTPSGRCIQEINYSRNDSAKFAPGEHSDSTHPVFYTLLLKRKVFEAGGVTPDTIVEPELQSTYVQELIRKGLLPDFLARRMNSGTPAVQVNDRLLADLRTFVEGEKFEYKDETMKKYDEMIAAATKEKYKGTFIASLRSLVAQFEAEHKNEFDRNRTHILRALQLEMAARTGGTKRRIELALTADRQALTAQSILSRAAAYERMLRKPH